MRYLKTFGNHNNYEDFTETESFVRPNVSYCIQLNEVHYNPIIDPFNGHAYVDLGLPSGALWATVNVGATNPTDYGQYFAYGEVTTKNTYTSENYRFYNEEAVGENDFLKYNDVDNLRSLEIVDDAARANWGGFWEIPTRAQAQELIINTTHSWKENYNGSGHNGILFEAENGNSIFIPASGLIQGDLNDLINLTGCVLLKELRDLRPDWGVNNGLLFFDDGRLSAGTLYSGRECGYSVRPVINGDKEVIVVDSHLVMNDGNGGYYLQITLNRPLDSNVTNVSLETWDPYGNSHRNLLTSSDNQTWITSVGELGDSCGTNDIVYTLNEQEVLVKGWTDISGCK